MIEDKHDKAGETFDRARTLRRLWLAMGACLWIAVIAAGLGVWKLSRNADVASGGKGMDEAHDTGLVHNESAPPAYPNPLADFSLTERSGKTVTKADLLGHPWVASFLFTRCAGPCPKVAGQVKLLQEQFKDDDVRFVTFTADPLYDTPERLQRYAEAIGADPEKWLFLTGDRNTIYNELIIKSFLVPVGIMGGEIIHSSNLMLVDSEGNVLGKYNALDDGEVADLKRVLRGRDKAAVQEINENTAVPLNHPAEAALIAVPSWVLALPAVNAGLNAVATVLLTLGYVLIRQRRILPHKYTMLSAFAVSVLFLACYLTYHFALKHYTGSSSKKFPGTGAIRAAYLSILVTHVTLAAAVPVLAGVTIYRALRRQWEKHMRIARITFPIWLYVSVTGVIIYLMLYHGSAFALF